MNHAVLELILQFVFELLLGVTGYAVMFVFSLGQVRPKSEHEGLATLIGILFWMLVAAVAYFATRE